MPESRLTGHSARRQQPEDMTWETADDCATAPKIVTAYIQRQKELNNYDVSQQMNFDYLASLACSVRAPLRRS